MFFSLVKEINKLISKGMSNIYWKVTTYSKYVTRGWQKFKPHDFPDTRLVKFTGSIQSYIFLLLYVLRQKFTYRFFPEKNSQDNTLPAN